MFQFKYFIFPQQHKVRYFLGKVNGNASKNPAELIPIILTIEKLFRRFKYLIQVLNATLLMISSLMVYHVIWSDYNWPNTQRMLTTFLVGVQIRHMYWCLSRLRIQLRYRREAKIPYSNRNFYAIR